MAKRKQAVRPPVTAEGHLRRLLSGAHSGSRYRWPHVLAIAEELTSGRSATREALMRRVALFQGRFSIDPTHGMPHAMPPEDIMRCIAVDALGTWDARKHRAVIRHVADTAERQMVAEIARAALRR